MEVDKPQGVPQPTRSKKDAGANKINLDSEFNENDRSPGWRTIGVGLRLGGNLLTDEGME